MFQILTVQLLETQLSVVSALVTVQVPQQLYTTKYRSNVTMECRFPVNGSIDLGLLTVFWEQKRQGQLKPKEVYTFCNGKAFPPSQRPDYIGRASLLHRELQSGQAILQIPDVKITDAGSYLCLIDYQGVDYKYIALEVKASYKRINTQVMRKPGEDKFVFMCQSDGFLLAEVFWQNENNFNLSGPANTTYLSTTWTTDSLYNVTSTLTFKPNTSENYSCVFWNKELNGETSANVSTLALMSTQYSGQKLLISFIVPTCVTVVVLLCALIILQKRKTFKNEQPKKGKLNPNLKDENSDDFNSQIKALYLSVVTASRDSGIVGL